jgi:hypothetical protein
MFSFNLKYFLLACGLFIVEVLIALYVHDNFFRPYFGDFLVVILVYCALKSFLNASTLKIAVASLLFAYLVEGLQYLHIVDRLGLSNNSLARTVIGVGFAWWDMLAYTLGICMVLLLEAATKKPGSNPKDGK